MNRKYKCMINQKMINHKRLEFDKFCRRMILNKKRENQAFQKQEQKMKWKMKIHNFKETVKVNLFLTLNKLSLLRQLKNKTHINVMIIPSTKIQIPDGISMNPQSMLQSVLKKQQIRLTTWLDLTASTFQTTAVGDVTQCIR